jgi:transcriptional regulator with XRE-family HTH domain
MAKTKLAYGHGTKNPSPVDVHVGKRVWQRRKLLGMTQTDLGDALGLTFQQVQKYEKGTNRISSSRLYELAKVFDAPIEYFFDDLPPEVAAKSPARRGGKAKKPASYEPNPMIKRETLELVRAYYQIEDPNVRKRVYELIKGVGSDSGKGG